MSTDAAISISNLTKQFGPVKAVDELSFSVRPGAVTGFLGPNGSGKTTTLRILLGLVKATSGEALIQGSPFTDLPQPAQVVGAALEASSFHPGRSGLNHLKAYAPQVGVESARCHEVLEFVGLADAKNRRVGGYSMGMRQRLGLAFALLGDPGILILDEPANGLDPQGIRWLRSILRSFASEGKTVLVSSHVLSEVESTVDDVVIISRGKLVMESSLADLRSLVTERVEVKSPTPRTFFELAERKRWECVSTGHSYIVEGVAADVIGKAAFEAGIELHQLADHGVGLEDTFLRLTADANNKVDAA